jgi:hypothetical protein
MHLSTNYLSDNESRKELGICIPLQQATTTFKSIIFLRKSSLGKQVLFLAFFSKMTWKDVARFLFSILEVK